MRRLSTELPFTCVTCELEIAGTPVFHVGLPFCCGGCVANGPCTCSYDEPEVTGHDGAVIDRRPAFAVAESEPAEAEGALALTAR